MNDPEKPDVDEDGDTVCEPTPLAPTRPDPDLGGEGG